MKNDIVSRVRRGGLAEDPRIKWPVMYFDGGGAAAGNAAADGVGSCGMGVGNIGSSDTGDLGSDTANAMGIAGLGFADAAAALGNSTAVGSSAVFGDPNSGFAVVSIPGIGEIGLPSGGMTATNGMSQNTLGALAAMGLGNMSISNTQTVDQAMAAMNAHSAMNNNLPVIMSALTGNPAFGQAISISQGIQGLMSGNVNLGQTAVNAAIGLAAQALGIPTGVVAGVVNGNPGQAVSAATASAIGQGLASSISSITGMPQGMVSAALGVSGVTSGIGQGISGAVNSAMGTSPTGQSNTAAIGQAISDAVGNIGNIGGSSSGTSAGASVGTEGGGGGGETLVAGLPTLASLGGEDGAISDPKFASSLFSGLSSPSLGSSKKDESKLFLDARPDFLAAKVAESGRDPESGLKMEELKQIVGGLSREQIGGDTRVFSSGGSSTCKSFDETREEFDSKNGLKLVPETSDFLPSPTAKKKAYMGLGQLKQIHPQISSSGNMGGMAHGGLPKKYQDAAPAGHNPEFVTGLTGFYACGRGTGQSDCIPAMLHDGDYVMDAEAVSALGDGSSKAGKEVLEKFHKQVPHNAASGGKVVPAKIADGEYVFPAGFVTALGGGDNKRGAEILDGLREKLRNHKRSAPTSKIPPKAKSPLDYLKMAKG
jgi:hypothetical protein